MDIDEQIKRCHEEIEKIKQIYLLEIAPWMRILENLYAIMPPKPIIIAKEDYDRMMETGALTQWLPVEDNKENEKCA